MLLAVIYLTFISLGLPDSLLGAAWPAMYNEFGVPVSFAGIISMTITLFTIISSLMSERVTKKFGAALVCGVSTLLTALALFGFSVSTKFWALVLWAVPYGLGAGSIDAAVNNYVALHYKSRHMSWLHCMWGLGATISPYIMGYALASGKNWGGGYSYVSIIQFSLAAIIFLSIPLWKKKAAQNPSAVAKADNKPVSYKKLLKLKGVTALLIAFFCYCALEQTAMLWSGSYLALNNGMSKQNAAKFASLVFIGITAGRAVNGFLTYKFSDKALIRMGQAVIGAGIILLFIPKTNITALIGLTLIGLGCAPVYPSFIHSTPSWFGENNSQALIGLQMALAYTGILVMPPLFGAIAQFLSISLLPVFLAVILAAMVLSHELLIKKINK